MGQAWQKVGMAPGQHLTVALCGLLALSAGCRKKPAPQPVPSTAASARPSESARAAASAHSVERDEAPTASSAAPDAGQSAPIELWDVGPAGPATASALGVVMVTRDDALLVAGFGRGDKARSLEPVEPDAGAFAALARGPAIAGDFAYWISRGRLVRRRIPAGQLETLAEDARDGSRVSALAANAGRPAVAAYVTRPASRDSDALARLWVEGEETRLLSPDGSAASSVSLAASGSDVVAVFAEGRTGMTPVHARTVRFEGGKVKLVEDVVVWVAGPAQPTTELVAASDPTSGTWGFVPLERDVTRFGLAAVQIGGEPSMGAQVTWRGYPNGLDPAPLAASDACGSSMLLYARPSEAKPGAPQELHLAPLTASGLGGSEIVARSRAFSNVSLAPVPGGILVAWVADHRTWAARLPCRAAAAKR